MNVSFDLFTELIGYRFFIQQRVLDYVAFRICLLYTSDAADE